MEQFYGLDFDDTIYHTLYGGDLKIAYNDKLHTYWGDVNNKFSLFPSASSVLDKTINKGAALAQWAANSAVNWLVNNPEDVEGAKKAHKKISNDAMDIGSIVHNWLEDYWWNMIPPPMPEQPEAQNGVNQFLDWLSDKTIEPILTEEKVASRKYKVAGTLDWFGKVNGEYMVIDYKTSKAIYSQYRLQTAIYAYMLKEENNYCLRRGLKFKRNNILIKLPKDVKIKRCILRLGKDGSFEPQVFEDSKEMKADLTAFVHALGLYRWLNWHDSQTKPKLAELESIKVKSSYYRS